MDIHLAKDCPMLNHCWECDQVLEIRELGKHLVEQCQYKYKYKFCYVCKKVHEKIGYLSHEESKPTNGDDVTCPLCHQFVDDTDQGWKKHLMEDRCYANARLLPV